MPNLYVTVSDTKSHIGISVTTYDAMLATMIEAASRGIDTRVNRRFYVTTATRYFDTGPSVHRLPIDDCLTLTSIGMDSERDDTYDGESWTEGTDFILWPDNEWPKTAMQVLEGGSYNFAKRQRRYAKLTGTWGYGDGESASPWSATAINVTADNETETTLDVSAEGTILAGHTILVESEQLYVSAATSDASNEITVERGVNGTTAAAHSAKPASLAKYPPDIVHGLKEIVANVWGHRDPGLTAERIGEYSYTRAASAESKGLMGMGWAERYQRPAIA